MFTRLGWDGQKWLHRDLNAAAAGNPVDAVADSALTSCALTGKAQRVYYIGMDGHVHELGSWDGQSWWQNDLNAVATGNPVNAVPAGG